jgi:hypothetical protein
LLGKRLAETEHAPRAPRTISLWLDAQLYLAEPTAWLYDVKFCFEGAAFEDGLKEPVADCLALARVDVAHQRLQVGWRALWHSQQVERSIGPLDVPGRHVEDERANTRRRDGEMLELRAQRHAVTSIGRAGFRL